MLLYIFLAGSYLLLPALFFLLLLHSATITLLFALDNHWVLLSLSFSLGLGLTGGSQCSGKGRTVTSTKAYYGCRGKGTHHVVFVLTLGFAELPLFLGGWVCVRGVGSFPCP